VGGKNKILFNANGDVKILISEKGEGGKGRGRKRVTNSLSQQKRSFESRKRGESQLLYSTCFLGSDLIRNGGEKKKAQEQSKAKEDEGGERIGSSSLCPQKNRFSSGRPHRISGGERGKSRLSVVICTLNPAGGERGSWLLFE